MSVNLGRVDRIIRVVLGSALLGAGAYYHSWWGAIGAVPLLTAFIGFCPAYLPFGISTCSLCKK